MKRKRQRRAEARKRLCAARREDKPRADVYLGITGTQSRPGHVCAAGLLGKAPLEGLVFTVTQRSTRSSEQDTHTLHKGKKPPSRARARGVEFVQTLGDIITRLRVGYRRELRLVHAGGCVYSNPSSLRSEMLSQCVNSGFRAGVFVCACN